MSWLGLIAREVARDIGGAAGEFSRRLSSYGHSGENVDAFARPTSPMQAIFDEAFDQGTSHVMLDEMIQRGVEKGLSFKEISDWRGLDSRGITVEIEPAGIEALREGLMCEGVPPGDQPLKASHSEISWEFNPWTTYLEVDTTCSSVDTTCMRGAVFFSAAREEGLVPVSITPLRGSTLDGCSIQAHRESDIPSKMHLSIKDSSARDAQFIGNGNTLTAETCDLTGLNAENSRALTLHINSSQMLGANLSGCTIAPDSSIECCNIAGNFTNMTAGNLSVRNSRLMTPGMFAGTDISNMDITGSIPTSPQVFEGAIYQGVELQGESLNTFMQLHEVCFGKESSAVAQPLKPKAAQPNQHLGDLGMLAADCTFMTLNERGNPSLPETDKFIEFCAQQVSSLRNAGMAQSSSDVAHANDPLNESVNLGQEHASQKHQRDHEGPSRQNPTA